MGKKYKYRLLLLILSYGEGGLGNVVPPGLLFNPVIMSVRRTKKRTAFYDGRRSGFFSVSSRSLLYYNNYNTCVYNKNI